MPSAQIEKPIIHPEMRDIAIDIRIVLQIFGYTFCYTRMQRTGLAEVPAFVFVMKTMEQKH